MAMTVTVTQGGAGSTANGLLLRVLIHTNAAQAAAQNGTVLASSHPEITPFYNRTVATTTAGSIVYGACADSTSTTFTAGTLTTILTQLQDATNGWAGCTWKATSRTGTPGPTILGLSAPTTDAGSWVAAEVLASGGTITQDASSPASASTTAATTITTASFTPPTGSLLVAIATSNAADPNVSLSITDSAGLTWRQLVFVNGGTDTASAIWVANAPVLVTATMAGAAANQHIWLQVEVLTGALEAGGASTSSLNASGGASAGGSLTPNATNSLPCWALTADNPGVSAFTALTNNTNWQSGLDPDDWIYGMGRYTGTVTAGTPVTFGGSCTSSDYTTWAGYEVRPSGTATPVADGSAPALASATGAGIKTVTSASFVPPAGSVLVAMINGGGQGTPGTFTMTVTGGGLTWTQRAGNSPAADQNSWVFTATMPGGAPPARSLVASQAVKRAAFY